MKVTIQANEHYSGEFTVRTVMVRFERDGRSAEGYAQDDKNLFPRHDLAIYAARNALVNLGIFKELPYFQVVVDRIKGEATYIPEDSGKMVFFSLGENALPNSVGAVIESHCNGNGAH